MKIVFEDKQVKRIHGPKRIKQLQETNEHNLKTLFVFLIHEIWQDIQRYVSLLDFPIIDSFPKELVKLVLDYEPIPHVLKSIWESFHRHNTKTFDCHTTDDGIYPVDCYLYSGGKPRSYRLRTEANYKIYLYGLGNNRILESWKHAPVCLDTLEKIIQSDNPDVLLCYVLSFSGTAKYICVSLTTAELIAWNEFNLPLPFSLVDSLGTDAKVIKESDQVVECRKWFKEFIGTGFTAHHRVKH